MRSVSCSWPAAVCGLRTVILAALPHPILPLKATADPARAESTAGTPSSAIPPGEAIPIVEINAGEAISAVPKRFQYALRLNIRGVYDDNIFLTNTDRIGDFYFAIEPGITLGFGDIVGREPNFLRFDYAPSIFLYTDHSDANAFQNIMRLEGQYRFGHLSLNLRQDVLLLDGANPGSLTTGANPAPAVNLDAGGDTAVNTYATNATFSYDLTGKTFLSGGVQYTVDDYEALIGSEVLLGNLFINYSYSPKLVIGLGGTVGYNWVGAPSPDQSFEQGNLRMTYEISGKVSLHATVGVEVRQFEGNSGGNHVSPVYELGGTYQPFDGTSLTLSGSRGTQNSAVLAGQDYDSTNITVGARQRLFRRIYVGLAAGYEGSDYFSTVQSVDASRKDNYFFLQPAVDVTLTRFWTVGVYYLHRQNDSTSDSSSFYDNQVGVRTSVTF